MDKPIAITGIQPTGNLHIGNYLGALAQMKELEDSHELYIFIADLHAITKGHTPYALQQQICDTAALYLAAGIKANFFIQSHIPAHTELMHLFNCITPISQLERMTQFKEKGGKDSSMGLMDYPVLMAADILLYNPDKVPTGKDQYQHLELTRYIARNFNALFGETFTLPEPSYSEDIKIMSLRDGTKKMSKSDPSDFSRINLLDSPDLIRRKIKKAKTDTIPGLAFDESRPEIYNLLNLYRLTTGKSQAEIEAEIASLTTAQFKRRLADAIIDYLAPIQSRFGELSTHPERLEVAFSEGRERASAIANTTLTTAKQRLGLL